MVRNSQKVRVWWIPASNAALKIFLDTERIQRLFNSQLEIKRQTPSNRFAVHTLNRTVEKELAEFMDENYPSLDSEMKFPEEL